MNKYIITEEQLSKMVLNFGEFLAGEDIANDVRSHPLSEHDAEIAKKERERVLKHFEQIADDLHDLESCVIKFHLEQMIKYLRGEP